MISRITRLAALVAAMIVAAATSSQANYTLTATSLTSTPANGTLGGTTFTFTESAGGVQTGSTASNFNVIDVGVSSTTPPPAVDTGSVSITELFTLTGSSGTENFTLNAMVTLFPGGNSGGVVTIGSGSTTVTSGSGYTVSFAGYAPPSPGSNGVGGTTGNFSIVVIPGPNVVPEPASVVMLGLGLVGLGGVAFRRRMAK